MQHVQDDDDDDDDKDEPAGLLMGFQREREQVLSRTKAADLVVSAARGKQLQTLKLVGPRGRSQAGDAWLTQHFDM